MQELPINVPGTIKSMRMKISSRKDVLELASTISAIKAVRFLSENEVEIYLTRELSSDELDRLLTISVQ